MKFDTCLLPLVALLRVLAPGFSPGFSGFLRCVEQNPRIPRLEFREIVPATACVSFFPCFSPSDPMYYTLSF